MELMEILIKAEMFNKGELSQEETKKEKELKNLYDEYLKNNKLSDSICRSISKKCKK